MRALVVYESMFGNTEAVARAVADGIRRHAEASVVEVGVASRSVDHVHLLVLGAPTHAFALSRPSTRRSALEQSDDGTLVSAGIGVREWLADLATRPGTTEVAAFDTRIAKPHLPGSAARGAMRRLRAQGHRTVAPAESFWVAGTTGPLLEGELDRARAWGEQLAARYAAAHPVAS